MSYWRRFLWVYYSRNTNFKEAVITYDREGSGRDMGGGLEKIKRGFWKSFFILERDHEVFCVLQSLENPGGFNLDQTLSYCASIQILMRSLKYANIIKFRSDNDSNSIL